MTKEENSSHELFLNSYHTLSESNQGYEIYTYYFLFMWLYFSLSSYLETAKYGNFSSLSLS